MRVVIANTNYVDGSVRVELNEEFEFTARESVISNANQGLEQFKLTLIALGPEHKSRVCVPKGEACPPDSRLQF